MFYAKVLIGDAIYLKSDKETRKMIKPPAKQTGSAKSKDYDSVKGNTNGSDVFMVYQSRKVLAKYLITYRQCMPQMGELPMPNTAMSPMPTPGQFQ